MNEEKEHKRPVGSVIFTALFALVFLLSLVAGCSARGLCLIFLICAAGVALAWLPSGKWKLRRAGFGFGAVILSGALYFALVEALSFNQPWKVLPVAILLTVALLTGIALLLTALLGRTAPAGIATGLICLVLGLINHYTLKFRGTVILPADIFSASTAAQVVNNYDFTPNQNVCIALAGLVLFFLILWKTNHRTLIRGRIASACGALVLVAAVLGISFDAGTTSRLGLSISAWGQTGRSKDLGFLLNALENIPDMIVAAPEGYSKEQAQQILAEHAAEETSDADVQPNIIVIMAEAMSELQDVADFEADSGYLDNLYSLAQEPGSKTGRCMVDIFGGNTSCTEFSFLTGCTRQFLGSGAAPYQQYIHTELEALPNYLLRTSGYATSALHPCDAANWGRSTSYPLMGFQEFVSIESPEFQDAERIRAWIADEELFDVMLERCESSEEPIFEFAVTMQCHGGYTTENYESSVKITSPAGDYGDVEQYLSLLKGTDEALGEFIEALRASDEPTIVLVFGDHLPALTSDFYTSCAAESDGTDLAQARRFGTPYLFWSNCGADFSDVPDLLSANFLAPYLLKAAGIPLSDYQQYLYDLSREYPIVTRMGIFDAEGNQCSYTPEDPSYEALHEYEIVQYYYLFGSK